MNLVPLDERVSINGKPCHVLDDFKGMTLVAGCTSEEVDTFEDFMVANEINQAEEINDIGLTEKLVNNMYCRKLFIPKGTFLTGKVHKKPYLDIFISGDVTVKSFCHDDTIESSTRLRDFQFLNGKPGRKRVLYAHADTIWLTIDPTEVDDVADAEDDISFMKLSQYCKEIKE